MLFVSTRGASKPVTSARAVLRGIAPDGGLYLPESIPVLDWRTMLPLGTQEMAEKILGALLPDFSDWKNIVSRAYTGKFETEELTPLRAVGGRYVLELFRGPTSAFKDVALCLLPQLITEARRILGIEERIVILTATSGDTGKAALEGFRDVPGTGIIVFYPYAGVSAVQRAQMVTQEGENVRVCAVRGNFDDAQSGVKEIFASSEGRMLSSANSINIGRLAPQIVYYFKAYADLVNDARIRPGERVDFTVPTGNFGDILAGYLAKRMGLPVGRLICASNANNVLTDFFRTGVYDRRRAFYKTTSPSMDILVSSNLERLLYLLGGAEETARCMTELKENGFYRVSDAMLAELQESFGAGCADDAETSAAIGTVWQAHRYLCDPHTAVAWHVADSFRTERPNVVLSTASPYKFPNTVIRALGGEPEADEFAQMEQLCAMTGVPVPKNLTGLGTRPERHTDVIEKNEMHRYVMQSTLV